MTELANIAHGTWRLRTTYKAIERGRRLIVDYRALNKVAEMRYFSQRHDQDRGGGVSGHQCGSRVNNMKQHTVNRESFCLLNEHSPVVDYGASGGNQCGSQVYGMEQQTADRETCSFLNGHSCAAVCDTPRIPIARSSRCAASREAALFDQLP